MNKDQSALMLIKNLLQHPQFEKLSSEEQWVLARDLQKQGKESEKEIEFQIRNLRP